MTMYTQTTHEVDRHTVHTVELHKCTSGLLVFPPSVLKILIFHKVLHNLRAPQVSMLMAGYENNCNLTLKSESEKIKRKIGSGGN